MPSSKPWETLPKVWKTESSFWAWVRGILRKGWSRHPIKIEYIKVNRKRIKNPVVKNRIRFPEVWGMTCQVCKKDFVQADIEIDHIGDNCSFTGLHDVANYVKHLYMITFNTIRAVCKPCHKIISHAQNQGISFEAAKREKEIIAFNAQDKDVVLAFLESKGYSGVDVSNAEKRRKLLEKLL